MKVGEALSLLKAKRSYLASQFELLKDQMFYEAGKKPDFSVSEILENIAKTESEIRQLKLSIMKTNVEEKLENGLTLAEAIISIGDLRSKMAQLEIIRKNPYKDRLFFRADDKRIDYIPQIPLQDIEKKIRELESKKNKLDAELQKANWSIEII
ncbi:MAG: hypothetical protein HY514_05080 [Candidatus Aenigmarchaeota archaeon]|nr:hypothetical protein [Candidatus Aenigmarchaeota archaeon]